MLAAALALAGSAAAAGLPAGEPKLLPPEQAFRFSARALDARTLEARFDVVDGYYLYRDKLAFVVEPSVGAGKPELPQGVRHHDEFFGDVETYRGRVVVRLPIAKGEAGQSLVLKAESQGCADAGICYPPTIQQVRLTLPAAGAAPGPIVDAPRKKGLFD
jgi:thiol:disulfide interchange protein DsbD